MDDEILQDFLVESEELIANLGQQIVDLEASPEDADLLNAVFRCFHTVKGGAGFLNLEPLVNLCHVAEELCNGLRSHKYALSADMVDALSAAVDQLQAQHAALAAGDAPAAADPALLERLRDLAGASAVSSAAPAASQIDLDNVPDDVDLDALLDQMHGVPASTPSPPAAEVVSPPAGESPSSVAPADSVPAAVASKASPPAKAVESSIRVDTVRLDAVMNLIGELVLARNQLKALGRGSQLGEEATRVSARIDRVTTELQGAVMKIRMQAIRKVFSRFPRIVRDLARSLGKQVSLELHGEDTELDKNLVEALADPLIHLVRNAVDHGIESPEQRRAVGKPEQGTVRLSAAQEGDDIVIRIIDDGAGMDPNRLRAKAVERGVLDQDEAARMDSADCFRIIFMAGFSTRDEVSDVSGRGVGMDVVKNRIDQLNGRIHIDSTLGEGSTMELRLPLTLAIMASLMVRAGQRIFSVPLSNVDDVLMFDPERYTRVDGRWVYRLDDDPVPVLLLGPWCGEYEDVPQRAHMVLLRSGSDRFGLVVDSVIGREEVVIKPLGPPLTDLVGFSGATVTGDGRVALILDPVGMLKSLRSGAIKC
ncbi:signal transduction histidine kinase [Oceanococcus atlanticus]|uniref:Chemotaxis protein CheA n=1 Tax=Oceanococcus atlanticus TaxID=1317117 RepID=A0A1Y1SGD8_9GAMM|nr:chemotaxis protein CheA [Oceanococcus atlanticus]ORE88734.1 signal transduction histidine kinase [Oceanococcus atlanticus]